jgi:hypothetical protein
MDQVADELNLYGVEEVPPEAIEQAVDGCEHAAHVLESIYLKNR